MKNSNKARDVYGDSRTRYRARGQRQERERKERINKLIIGLRQEPTSLLKITAQPEKRDVFMKNGNERRDVLGDSRKRYRCPWAEIGKYGPRKEKKN